MADAPAPASKPKPIQAGRPILAPNDQDTGATENALLLGIDLGTSRSSIVSINGARKTVESYVGYVRARASKSCLSSAPSLRMERAPPQRLRHVEPRSPA